MHKKALPAAVKANRAIRSIEVSSIGISSKEICPKTGWQKVRKLLSEQTWALISVKLSHGYWDGDRYPKLFYSK